MLNLLNFILNIVNILYYKININLFPFIITNILDYNVNDEIMLHKHFS
jgi:hypothetical protein